MIHEPLKIFLIFFVESNIQTSKKIIKTMSYYIEYDTQTSKIFIFLESNL